VNPQGRSFNGSGPANSNGNTNGNSPQKVEEHMSDRGIIVALNAGTGVVGFRLEDGSHVLADQLGAGALHEGQVLEGRMHTVGIETLTDSQTGATEDFFVLAYDLSLEAIQAETAEA